MRMKAKEEPRLLVTAADGMPVWVPMSRAADVISGKIRPSREAGNSGNMQNGSGNRSEKKG